MSDRSPSLQAFDELLATTAQEPKEEGRSEELKAFDRFLGRGEALPEVVTFDSQMNPTVTRSGYSQNDLTKDEYYEPIVNYMVDRFGQQSVRGRRQEVVDRYLNNMRGFAGGNSVRSVNEIAHLNSLEDSQQFKNAQSAYAIYEGMSNAFSSDVEGSERREAIKDFARSGILDPINVVSLGLGKLVAGGGARLVSQEAQRAAVRTFKNQVAQGIARDVAEEAAVRTFASVSKQVTAKGVQERATREAIRAEASKSLVSRFGGQQAVKELVTTGIVDGAAAAATDYMYQNAMIRTKIQDEYNVYQTGVAALASIAVMGSVQLGSQAFARQSIAGPEALKLEPKGVKLSELAQITRSTRAKVPPRTPAKDGAPRELSDLDSQFWITMAMGDDEAGVKGLAQIMKEQGYGWAPRDKDDTITQFLADAIRESDPQDFREFIRAFDNTSLGEIKNMGREEFADAFVDKLSLDGQVMNALSRSAKVLGQEANNVKLRDYLEFQLTGQIPSGSTKKESTKTFLERVLPEGYVAAGQNRVIRAMVSNLSTSFLNMTGYAAATATNSAADITRAALYAPAGVLKKMQGADTYGAFKPLIDTYQNTKFKVQNTLDPMTTADFLKNYADVRQKPMEQIVRVLNGGVEDLDELFDKVDLDKTKLGQFSDDAIDLVQMVNLVTAQDTITKSIEFATQLDKSIRQQYNMGLEQFFKEANYKEIMASPEYAMMELKAVDEVMSSIFSKSYKNKSTAIGQVAGMIEDARNIPGIGLLVPFGRFFNNTVAFMADNSGASALLRTVGVNYNPNSTYTLQELYVRGAVGITAALSMVEQEKEYIKQGLAWNQEEGGRFLGGETGAVIDEKYEFPYAAYKAAARLLAYNQMGMDVPEEVSLDIFDTFVGQLTRDLDATGQGATDIVIALASGEGKEIMDLIFSAAGTVTARAISAATRPIDPLNSAVGLAQEEDYKTTDRGQGNTVVREAFRYMDRIFEAAGLAEYEEKYSPTVGRIRQQPSKFMSTNREVEMTELARLHNLVGIPPYKAGVISDSGATKNRYAQMFDQLNEEGAARLMASEAFRKATQEQQLDRYREIMQENRQRVHVAMQLGNLDDMRMSVILDIEKPSTATQKQRKEALRRRGVESLDDLDYNELGNLYMELRSLKQIRDIEYFD